MGTGEKFIQIEPEGAGPQWEQEDLHTAAAAARGKRNLKITDVHGLHESLFSKSAELREGQPDTIALLHREMKFLEKLRGSGVTPNVFALKESEDKTQGHLLIETLPGNSLESRGRAGEAERRDFGAIVTATLGALDKVHQRGVLVADVNAGTFLLDYGPDRRPSVKVVDFELAVDEEHLNQASSQEHLKIWYRTRGDIGIELASLDSEFKLTSDTARAAERSIAVRKLMDFFLGLGWERIDRRILSAEEQEDYDDDVRQLSPKIGQAAMARLRKQYLRAKEAGVLVDSTISESEYVDRSSTSTVKSELVDAMAHRAFPHALKRAGISADEELVKYLQCVLSPQLEDRPDDLSSVENFAKHPVAA